MWCITNFLNGKTVGLCTLQKQLKAFLLLEQCLVRCKVSGSRAGPYQAVFWSSASTPSHS